MGKGQEALNLDDRLADATSLNDTQQRSGMFRDGREIKKCDPFDGKTSTTA